MARPGRSLPAQLEVAVLDRERPRRTFRRIGGPLLDRLLSTEDPTTGVPREDEQTSGTARHAQPGPAGRARAHGRPRGTGPAGAGPAVTIAVTGATGALGAAVARLLAEAGVEQRLVVRDASRAPRLPGAEVAVASYADTEAMARALDGVRTLFLVSGHEDPDRISLHRSAVAGARRCRRRAGGLHLVHGCGAAGDLPLRTRPRRHRARHTRRRHGADRDAQRPLRRHGAAVRRRGRRDPGAGRRRARGLGGPPRRRPARGGPAHRRGPRAPGLRRVRAGGDRPARDGTAAGRRERAGHLLPARDAAGGAGLPCRAPRLAGGRLDRLLPGAAHRGGVGDQPHHRAPHRHARRGAWPSCWPETRPPGPRSRR